ncbi:MAG: anti-sigma F factor [Clostridia bacterium]|nr:anti-sigma F factor [Clostridia bacterium]
MNNSMKLEFLSMSENESFARAAIAAFVSQLDPTVDDLEDIRTAVSEAVTNAIVHGYSDSMGFVRIACSYSADTVVVSVSDSGRGISDISLARTPLYTGTKNQERSGLGFTVMETFMDSVDVESAPRKGTTVIMRKKLAVCIQEAEIG